MKLIVGLGNPGEKYESTRHNLGVMVVEHFVKDATSEKQTEKGWSEDKFGKSRMFNLEMEIKGTKEKILIIEPQTFMNGSGFSVNYYHDRLNIDPSDIIVIHDDIDLPLGKIRIRMGGASAGHRGVSSIIDHIKTDCFVRIRLGVDRGKLDAKIHREDRNMHRRKVEKFVLSPFTQKDAGEVKKMIKKASQAIFSLLEDGLEKTANRFN